MTENIKGIIIRVKDYKDNALLIDVLSREYGLLSLVAKGACKPQAKLHFFVSSLVEFTINYQEGRTMFSIINSKEIKKYIKYDDSILNAFTSIIYEIVYRSKEICDELTFDNVYFYLENISSSNYYLLGSMLLSYFMRLHGIEPYVDGCVKCNNKKVISISNDLGGFVCKKDCLGVSFYPVEHLRNFRIICKSTYHNYESIKDLSIDFDLFKCMCDFFIYNSEIKLKSYDFFMRLI